MKQANLGTEVKRVGFRARYAHVISFLALLAMAAVLTISATLFLRSYRELRNAVQSERMEYVQEIAQQIISSQRFMEKEYSESVLSYAHIVSKNGIQSLINVKEQITDRHADEILLITQTGNIVDLSGQQVLLPDRTLLMNLKDDGSVVQLFTSLNYERDCWLFATSITPCEVEGVVYTHMVLAIPAETFRNHMTIALFDKRGASYIIHKDGSIAIKPADLRIAFGGYNLFASMLQMGAPEAGVRSLQDNIMDGIDRVSLLHIGDAEWLISHSAIDDNTVIVVAVPLTLTAAATYAGMNNTILFATVTVALISSVAVLFILFFFYRDRRRTREAMAVAAKSDFFSKMSHDIRTPLNAVIGLELLALDSTREPKVRDYLKQSSAAANYLLSIINDVLDMSRIESGKLTLASEPFDMNVLIEEIMSVAQPLMREKNIGFHVETDASLNTAYIGDAVRIKQVIVNLLSNAAKFTKIDGRVWMTVARLEDESGQDLFTITIADTGIGISKAYLPHIFKPFEQERSSYTQQYAGSGLGLSIAHSLVTMMGGTIEVDSQEGVGTTFTVTLPLERGEPVKRVERRAEEAALPTFAGRRVLLAEDNLVNRQVATAILIKKFDLQVESVSDGQMAIEAFAASERGHFDLILMDVKMPVMDGLEATRHIRALPRPDAATIPIVALSANAFEEDVALSLAAGMNDHLSKPIDIAAISAVLKRYIRPEEESP